MKEDWNITSPDITCWIVLSERDEQVSKPKWPPDIHCFSRILTNEDRIYGENEPAKVDKAING